MIFNVKIDFKSTLPFVNSQSAAIFLKLIIL